jgi:apolipoprotein N-acyltransferase
MKKLHLILLSLASGLLLAGSWPMNGFPGFLFIAFLPLLYLEDDIASNQQKYSSWAPFFFSLPGLALWNALTTFWICNSTAVGGIVAILLNSILMAFVVQIYHLIRRNVFRFRGGHWILAIVWISLEYLHLNWSLNWPWLNIGNAFSMYPTWIQWYEFTGTFGGTLWVFAINLFLFESLMGFMFGRAKSRVNPVWASLFGVLIFILPMIISKRMYNNYEEVQNPVDVLVMQPNHDPYSDQYDLSPEEVLDNVYELVDSYGDTLVDFIVLPESVIQERNVFERKLMKSSSVQSVIEYMKDYPETAMCIGAATYKLFLPGEELSPSARLIPRTDQYYDAYNTIYYVDNASEIQLYHKSKLTPGVEAMPLIKYLPFIEKLALDLGGTVGSLGIDLERKPFYNVYNDILVAPLICYESIFGEFMTGFVKNGAQVIFVMTNDGWWKDTPGHRQHMSYSALRAIETRRSVARSANTGISCFINQRGDILESTPYWVKTAIRRTINANDEITFYVKNGDYIARISVFTLLTMLLISIVRGIMMRSERMKRI